MKNAIFAGSVVGILLQQVEYRLTVIEDETEVPLASGVTMEYYWPTVAVMVLAAIFVTAAVYLLNCNRYRMRLRELAPEGCDYKGWQLSRLKEAVSEAEIQKTEDIEDVDIDGITSQKE